MFDYAKMVMTFLIVVGNLNSVNSSMCREKACWRGQYYEISCGKGKLLIENVTKMDKVTENKMVYVNLRRMCNGKQSCDFYQICRDSRNHNLYVTFTCNKLPETVPSQMCMDDIKVLNQNHGNIVSPSYPDSVLTPCYWRIEVPRNHFAIISLLDLEKVADTCKGGLQIRAKQECPQSNIPPGLICKLDSRNMIYKACGDVDIDFVSDNVSKQRFWISYKVLPLYGTIPEYYDTTHSCPAGTDTKQEVRRVQIMAPSVPPVIITRAVTYINTTLRFENETTIGKVDTRQKEGINSTEKMIFYVAIALAFVSLNGLIVVTIVCIRRQRRLKASGPIIDHSAIPSTCPSSFHSNRPLPPVQPQHSQLTLSPSLMEGYGIVADDIARDSNDQTSQTSAYAEVDDTLTYRPFQEKYRSNKQKMQEPVENLYSELTDTDKSTYCEIADTVWHNTPISQSDQAKLIKDRSRKSQLSNNSVKSRPSSFEGPLSHFDSRKSHFSEQSDSEDSLFGNEQYDYIQSVHV